MNELKLGLIGAGEFGNFASDVIELLPTAKLVAVADTNESAAKSLAQKYRSKFYQDYNELLADPEVEIVLINTPNYLHARMSIDAIEANKKVLCEKPLGINQHEVEQVVKSVEQNNGTLLVNLLLPNSSIYKKLKNIISTNLYGQLKYVAIQNYATESTIQSDWYWQNEKSGGWFLTADVHFYDLLQFLQPADPISLNSVEYSQNGKTSGIFTGISYDGFVASIFHDFNAGYERARLVANFAFEQADIELTGWIPTSMTIKTSLGQEVIKEDLDREKIYRHLVADNIKLLSTITPEDSLANLKRTISASKIAFQAQEGALQIEIKENNG